MLTDEHKQKLDEAAIFHKFKESPFYAVLMQMLAEYRLEAIRLMEEDRRITNADDTLEMVRRVHAANSLKIYIEMRIDDKVSQVADVAEELGVDLDELTIRRDIES